MDSAECRAYAEGDETLEHYLCECQPYGTRRGVYHGFQCSNLRDIGQLGWKKSGFLPNLLSCWIRLNLFTTREHNGPNNGISAGALAKKATE